MDGCGLWFRKSGGRQAAVENIHRRIKARAQTLHDGICGTLDHLQESRAFLVGESSQHMAGELVACGTALRVGNAKLEAWKSIGPEACNDGSHAIVTTRRTRGSKAEGAQGKVNIIKGDEHLLVIELEELADGENGISAGIHESLGLDQHRVPLLGHEALPALVHLKLDSHAAGHFVNCHEAYVVPGVPIF